MIQRLLLHIILLLGVITSFGQTRDTLFAQANMAYQNGKFEQAIHSYQDILKSGYHSADLYYNIGNAYFKLNNLAPSIYNYEKALLLNPDHNDALNNLMFAKRSTIDVIEPLPKTLFQRINQAVIYPISYNTWAWIAVFFAISSSALFILYYFSLYSQRKKLFFILSFTGLGLFLLTLGLGIMAKHHFVNDRPAIVFAKQISVNNEPMTDATENFVLHEGTKVQVKEDNNDWYRIEIADGKTGWLQKDKIRLLK
ncbi:MAG: ion channel protein [Flavobacteriales bacterium]|nr:MAG: ion channel protein [Flavobacteriales bacterium]